MKLDAKVPSGSLAEKWQKHKFNLKLVNPANKRKYKVIVVGTGLAGSSAAASLAELGYCVESFCIQDSPRRAHSIAAQGGINSTKNYPNDGDSAFRLFYDTIKGGDFRSREANVYRLAEISSSIIDQCVAQGVPFAREYSGTLANRSFGGAQVSRTFYARGQTGQQLLLGAYSSLNRQIALGNVKMYTRSEMLDLILIYGKARGIIVRNLLNGKLSVHLADAVCLCTGGYGNVFYLSTNAMASNVTASWRAYKKGAFFANPCFVQIHPTCIPVKGDFQSKLTLMSESLRNDGRVWVPKRKKDQRNPREIPEEERYYFLEEKYPSFGNLVPRDLASRNAKYICDQGMGGGGKEAVYLDFSAAIKRDGEGTIKSKYGNLFDMYERITGDSPYKTAMKIFPAVHYTMGGLWVDYNLMSTLPGLFVLGEANFSDHGANRLGASALMQGLADGYFIIPASISAYLCEMEHKDISPNAPEIQSSLDAVNERIKRFLSIRGKYSVDDFHRRLGKMMWNKCGMSRNEKDLKSLLSDLANLKEDFWNNVNVTGTNSNLNISLEKAGRVADFLELGELMALDALNRNESCGGHFREESQTKDNEAKRDDENFSYVAAWAFKGEGKDPELHKEKLSFDNVKLSQRSYK